LNEHKIHTDIGSLKQALLAEDQIVFTNGCFDLLHIGHIDYLTKAKAAGTTLVVGVNSDASVTRLKGATRPINPLTHRLGVLSALECVDHLIAFDEDTPYDLIAEIQPDILVKGSDYKAEDIVGYDIVTAKSGTVKTIEIVHHISSSELIEKIKSI